jgi:glucose/arabinose dehydrogenase
MPCLSRRLLVTSDPDRADPSSESMVLTQRQSGVSHKGGDLMFGPDGMLYIGLGDGGSRDGMDHGRGQSLDDFLGALLRIDVSAGSGYAIPPDNPLVGTAGARGEIWSYGFRNPWRYSFDATTGDLYIGDVGESHWEEIDRARASDGGGRGLNYGWSIMEGNACETAGCDTSGLTPPLLAYGHDEGCAVVGGYVYRGSAVPSLLGQYLYGDYCGGWIRSIHADGDPGRPQDWPALSPGPGISSFGQDAAGELYLLTTHGDVLKIVQR